jgi:ArsR family transcriptional regulator
MEKNLKVIQAESCCAPVARTTLNSEQAKTIADVFAALSDPNRLAIINLLAESAGEVCVCDITSSFKLGQPTISHHLRILKEAGLVSADKRGKWVYYSLVKGRAEDLKAMVDQLLGAPQLALL